MKQQRVITVTALIIIAAIAVVLVSRKDLWEVRIQTDPTEVAVFMAYESKS
ncbi:Hok/Gef family protein [Erwinia aphidicola]|nr:Hok/Gef family protein [Erwinia aphidicola]